MSWCYNPPTDPMLKYNGDAMGHDVPAFAVVMVPQTCRGPMRAVIEPSLPGERGVVFHARACELARHEARILGLPAELVGVWFTNTLPTLEWRRDWQARALLRWCEAMPGTPPELRSWARVKLKALTEGVV